MNRAFQSGRDHGRGPAYYWAQLDGRSAILVSTSSRVVTFAGKGVEIP